MFLKIVQFGLSMVLRIKKILLFLVAEVIASKDQIIASMDRIIATKDIIIAIAERKCCCSKRKDWLYINARSVNEIYLGQWLPRDGQLGFSQEWGKLCKQNMDDIKKYSHDPLLKVKNLPPMIPPTAVKTVAFLAAVRECGCDLPSLYEVLSHEVHCYPSWSGDLISFVPEWHVAVGGLSC